MSFQNNFNEIRRRIISNPGVWAPYFQTLIEKKYGKRFKFWDQESRKISENELKKFYSFLAKNEAFGRNLKKRNAAKEFIKIYINDPPTVTRDRYLLTLAAPYTKVVPLWNNRAEHLKKMYNFFSAPYKHRIKRMIQRRPNFKIKSNVNFLKRSENVQMLSNIRKLENYAKPLSIEDKNKLIRQKLNKPVRLIQEKFRGHRIPRFVTFIVFEQLLLQRPSLHYYAGVVDKLRRHWAKVNTKNQIHTKIAACHIKNNEMPAAYLLKFMKQVYMVAKTVTEMSKDKQEKYLDRLEKELFSGMPCLENFLEGLINALYPQGFVWKGRNIDPPLNNDNKRYLTNVVKPALISWVSTMNENNRRGYNNKSFSERKNLFWKKIRNLNIIIPGGFFQKVQEYNTGGNRFNKSKAARLLNNNNNTFNYNN